MYYLLIHLCIFGGFCTIRVHTDVRVYVYIWAYTHSCCQYSFISREMLILSLALRGYIFVFLLSSDLYILLYIYESYFPFTQLQLKGGKSQAFHPFHGLERTFRHSVCPSSIPYPDRVSNSDVAGTPYSGPSYMNTVTTTQVAELLYGNISTSFLPYLYGERGLLSARENLQGPPSLSPSAGVEMVVGGILARLQCSAGEF